MGPCLLALPELTQFILDLHGQVVRIHNDPVFRCCLDRSHHCEDDKPPGWLGVYQKAPTAGGVRGQRRMAGGELGTEDKTWSGASMSAHLPSLSSRPVET